GTGYNGLQIVNNYISGYSQSAVFMNRGGTDITIAKNVLAGRNFAGTGKRISANGPKPFNELWSPTNTIVTTTARSGSSFVANARWGLNLTSFGNTGADRGGQNSVVTENVFSGNGVVGSPTTTGDVVFSATQAAGAISTNTLFNNSLGSATAFVYNGTETINT